MGEEFRYTQMNKSDIHIQKRSQNGGYQAESNTPTMILQNKGT